MSLDDLQDAVEEENAELTDHAVSLDRETRTELAMLSAALDAEDVDDIVQRAVHQFFDTLVQSGKLDFHLRSEYDATYDEYLSGMSFEEMTGGREFPQTEEDGRRYQY
ncbi:hypothetical protein U3A55_07415 [Salarchaeum sp. III]|uniref:hypothetical protein n=1 Tax=Salarchaeum sp. III TaxID=3107927 RepID=UPI002ED956BE